MCANNVPWTPEQFEKEAKKVHKAKYTYTGDVKKVGDKNKFEVECPLHGTWYATSHDHISKGQGCPDVICIGNKISENRSDNLQDFITKAQEVHGDKYDYSLTAYHRTYTSISLKCNTCDKVFKQKPSDHLSGNGCPPCAGRNSLQLYVFQVKDGENTLCVKVGKANHYRSRLTKQRLGTPYEVTVLGVWEMPTPEQCSNTEKAILDNYNRSILNKQEYLDGYTETYSLKDLSSIIKDIVLAGGEPIINNLKGEAKYG